MFMTRLQIQLALNWNRNWKSINVIKLLSLQTVRYRHYPFNIPRAYQIMWSISLNFFPYCKKSRAEAQLSNYLPLGSFHFPSHMRCSELRGSQNIFGRIRNHIEKKWTHPKWSWYHTALYTTNSDRLPQCLGVKGAKKLFIWKYVKHILEKKKKTVIFNVY